ncbi:MAG: chemotaxis protein CheW [Myxococcota bacterium]
MQVSNLGARQASLGLGQKYLTFVLDDVRYGIKVEHVVEIIGVQRITRVPDSPGYVKGVINLRGRVIPVVDVRLRFGLFEREHDSRTCIIVIRVPSGDVGLIVDTVQEVLDVATENIEPVPAMSASMEDVVAGMAKVADSVIILLSVERLVGART